MPSRNIVKQYVEGGYYHVYNRGVEKRDIFLDPMDYHVFTKYLRQMLSPKDPSEATRFKNYSGRVTLIAYCLMPNHFHLMLQQSDEWAMAEFMRSLATAYSMYFNNRHRRVGKLFQAHYKAAHIDNDEYLVHLSRYIHLNPRKIGHSTASYEHSSYKYFESQPSPDWLSPAIVTEILSGDQYADFCMNAEDSSALLSGLTIE